MYILGTAAMLVALPAETVSITNGMPQATAALTQRIGAPWLAPVAAVVAILLALGNLGGVGAWLAGSARLPSWRLGRALPAAFGRIPPALAHTNVGAGAAGWPVSWSRASRAHRTERLPGPDQTTLILFFIPYLYLFGAYLRLRRPAPPARC